LAATNCIHEGFLVGVFGALVPVCGEVFPELKCSFVRVEAKFPVSVFAITALVRLLFAYIQAAVTLELYHDR
jgi:hypothetical protein